jgi:hypothetical protein
MIRTAAGKDVSRKDSKEKQKEAIPIHSRHRKIKENTNSIKKSARLMGRFKIILRPMLLFHQTTNSAVLFVGIICFTIKVKYKTEAERTRQRILVDTAA